MSAMEDAHATELARLKDASDKELMKVQQENYVLSTVGQSALIIN